MKKILPFLGTAIVFLIIFLLSTTIPQEQIETFLKTTGVFAPIIFILFSLISYIIAPLSGTPILFVGYQLFGSSVVLLSTIATFISFTTNFWLARAYGRPLVTKLVGKHSMKNVDKLITNYGLVTLTIFRIFQGSIHDFVSYASGLTSIKFTPYLIISTLSLIPGTILWYWIAQKIKSPLFFTLLSLVMSGGFSIVFIFGQQLLHRSKMKNHIDKKRS